MFRSLILIGILAGLALATVGCFEEDISQLGIQAPFIANVEVNPSLVSPNDTIPPNTLVSFEGTGLLHNVAGQISELGIAQDQVGNITPATIRMIMVNTGVTFGAFSSVRLILKSNGGAETVIAAQDSIPSTQSSPLTLEPSEQSVKGILLTDTTGMQLFAEMTFRRNVQTVLNTRVEALFLLSGEIK